MTMYLLEQVQEKDWKENIKKLMWECNLDIFFLHAFMVFQVVACEHALFVISKSNAMKHKQHKSTNKFKTALSILLKMHAQFWNS